VASVIVDVDELSAEEVAERVLAGARLGAGATSSGDDEEGQS
jgi:hypothetical protein